MSRIPGIIVSILVCALQMTAVVRAVTPGGAPSSTPAPESSPTLPSGGAYVTTLPTDAEVWIDGTYVGRSPVLTGALSIGSHTVTVTKSGWQLHEEAIAIDPDHIALVSFQLQVGPHPARGDGSYVLDGLPPGANVSVDGVKVPQAPGGPHTLVSGTHQLSVTGHDGLMNESFLIVPGMTTHLIVRPAPRHEKSSGVVALVDDYLPEEAYSVDETHFQIHYSGHNVSGSLGDANVNFDGKIVRYTGVPVQIDGRLYLPLALLGTFSGQTTKSK